MFKIRKLLLIICIISLVISLSSCGIIERIIDNKKDRTYTIHFNANGGEGVMDDYLVKSGDDGWLPKCEFTKAGFECVAWGMDAAGTSFATQIDNMTLRLPSDVKNGDVVELYAIWTTSGFTFELETMGYFAHAKITMYSGNDKDIIVPAWFEGSFSKSSYGSCSINGMSSEIFKDNVILETVKNIPINNLSRDMFNGCTSLKSIEMHHGNKIQVIGERTFYNCFSLQEIELTNELNSIGNEAFYMCTSIKRLVIPSHIEEIGINAFYGWTKDQAIEFTKFNENQFGDEWLNGCNATIIWSNKESS